MKFCWPTVALAGLTISFVASGNGGGGVMAQTSQAVNDAAHHKNNKNSNDFADNTMGYCKLKKDTILAIDDLMETALEDLDALWFDTYYNSDDGQWYSYPKDELRDFLKLARDFITVDDDRIYSDRYILATLTKKTVAKVPDNLSAPCRTAILETIASALTTFFDLMGVGSIDLSEDAAAVVPTEGNSDTGGGRRRRQLEESISRQLQDMSFLPLFLAIFEDTNPLLSFDAFDRFVRTVLLWADTESVMNLMDNSFVSSVMSWLEAAAIAKSFPAKYAAFAVTNGDELLLPWIAAGTLEPFYDVLFQGTVDTCTATIAPTSNVPSTSPSSLPSAVPSLSISPSTQPSGLPSTGPSDVPSASSSPSQLPSNSPSANPSQAPSLSAVPSSNPSQAPSISVAPSTSAAPSNSPSLSNAPSESPSQIPSTSTSPSTQPSLSMQPSNEPSVSTQPSSQPSTQPSQNSDAPSSSPSGSSMPSSNPSGQPSGSGSGQPSVSSQPSLAPSTSPSSMPSSADPFNFELDFLNVTLDEQNDIRGFLPRLEGVLLRGLETYTLPGSVADSTDCGFNPATVDDIRVCVQFKASAFGSSNVLGLGGPIFFPNTDGTVDRPGAIGTVTLNPRLLTDFSDLFEPVVVHEFLHVMGIGTLWGRFAGLIAEDDPCSGYNADSMASKRYQEISDCGATIGVPIQVEGTSCGGHWDLDCFTSAELMTPSISSGSTPSISAITLGSLEDMTYSVDYTKAEALAKTDLAGSCQCPPALTTSVFENNTASISQYFPLSEAGRAEAVEVGTQALLETERAILESQGQDYALELEEQGLSIALTLTVIYVEDGRLYDVIVRSKDVWQVLPSR